MSFHATEAGNRDEAGEGLGDQILKPPGSESLRDSNLLRHGERQETRPGPEPVLALSHPSCLACTSGDAPGRSGSHVYMDAKHGVDLT